MDLASDITAEDIETFLQEADENLQALDENIVRLEQEKDSPELLQEIFRISHTLKGSSAMFGHQEMAELAHAMESLFDQVRNGAVSVTTEVIDILLHSLDTLRELKDELASHQRCSVDILPLVRELESVTEVKPPDGGGPGPEVGGTLATDQAITQRIQTAQLTGLNVYQVRVDLNEESTWTSVRCFQVIQALSLVSEIIMCSPTPEEVELGKVGAAVQAIVVTEHEAGTLEGPLRNLEDVTNVKAVAYSLEDQEVAVGLAAVVDDLAGSKEVLGDSLSARPSGQTQTVRIDVERLENLMNTIGELVIDRTRFLQISKLLEAKYKEDDLIQALGETSAHVVKVVDELQEEIMKARMLPIGTVFSGFPRMVRDLAQKVSKQVNFNITGQDTEIDRTVIERIRDPLVHLLRNAVDHGIEAPDKRESTGKPPAGTLRLSASHEHGQIVITVEDDGKGIDPKAVRESAVSKGIITADSAGRLSDAEAIELIFAPGASTAEQTTDISGRGVGMDIVKTNIEAINGFVKVDTKVGQGTKFTLMLPLTLATINALLFSLRHTVYAVPLVYVLEAVKLEPEEILTIEGKEVIILRETVVPVLRLSDIYNLNGNESDTEVTTYVVVVRFGERLVGLAVDSLMELQEVTVKPLGSYLGEVKGIAGVSILGDGQVVLILDVPTLINFSVTTPLNGELVA